MSLPTSCWLSTLQKHFDVMPAVRITPARCVPAPHIAPSRTCLQDEQQLARCVAEANVYALAAHQYWGTWSFLQVSRHGADCFCTVARILLQCEHAGLEVAWTAAAVGPPVPGCVPPCRLSGPPLTLTTCPMPSCGGASTTGGRQSSLLPQMQPGCDAGLRAAVLAWPQLSAAQ